MINLSGTPKPNGAAQAAPGLIAESSDRAFKADVIDASMQVPVLVDFWAPWCGPCRQLTPTLEKVIAEKNGQIRLIKINIDENPAIAGQLGIQSIPAVFAFAGGRPVDGFMGALPESEVRKFAERVIAAAPPAPGDEAAQLEAQVKQALEAATEALANGDVNRAAQVYAMILQRLPDNVPALLGMARIYLDIADTEQAQAMLDMVPEEARKGEDYASLASALRLAGEAAGLSEADSLVARIAADPEDLQARYDLAVVLNAQGDKLKAAETLVGLMRKSREWNEDGARKKLLELFEAWGPKDPATLKGRRLLSAVLFS